MPAELEQIRAHWEDWAKSFGTDLKATTRTSTAKELEVDALTRVIGAIRREADRPLSIMEAGCGNGHNCIRLAATFPDCRFEAFDYIPEMVAAARELANKAGLTDDRLRVFQDDVLALNHVRRKFDLVFTVRCLINLNTDELQIGAISKLAKRIFRGGHLVMIENSKVTHGAQNRAREAVGLPARAPAEFNRFFDEEAIRSHLNAIGFDVTTEDFGSLHDLVLYALVPMVNGGTVDYAHPLVEAATKLSMAVNQSQSNAFGAFGQNRMFICRRS